MPSRYVPPSRRGAGGMSDAQARVSGGDMMPDRRWSTSFHEHICRYRWQMTMIDWIPLLDLKFTMNRREDTAAIRVSNLSENAQETDLQVGSPSNYVDHQNIHQTRSISRQICIFRSCSSLSDILPGFSLQRTRWPVNARSLIEISLEDHCTRYYFIAFISFNIPCS